MEPSTLKSTTDAQMPQRRHSDPPALWCAVILGSVVVHLGAFGILRLLLMAGVLNMHSANQIIPIDIIAIAPSATSTTRITPKTVATATNKQTKPNSRTQNRNTTASNTSATLTQSPGERKRSRSTPSGLSPSINTSSNIKKSPTSTSSLKPSGGNQPKTNSNSSTGKNIPSGKTTPASRPSDSTNSSTGQTPNSSQSKGGLIAVPGNLALIPGTGILLNPDDPNNNVELATLLDDNKQLSSEDLKQLGISLDQDLELKVRVSVETNGTAQVHFAKVVRGSISSDKAVALAKKIISHWLFKPTTEARKDNRIRANYDLPLTIHPTQK